MCPSLISSLVRFFRFSAWPSFTLRFCTAINRAIEIGVEPKLTQYIDMVSDEMKHRKRLKRWNRRWTPPSGKKLKREIFFGCWCDVRFNCVWMSACVCTLNTYSTGITHLTPIGKSIEPICGTRNYKRFIANQLDELALFWHSHGAFTLFMYVVECCFWGVRKFHAVAWAWLRTPFFFSLSLLFLFSRIRSNGSAFAHAQLW